MPRFPSEFIDTLADRADIVDVVSDYVSLKQTGNHYLGLCPFHREKTPSFTVNADKQLFYCFGCHAGGNVFGFVMKSENIEFADAVKLLADRVNLPIPQQAGFVESVSRETKQRLYEANKEAARFFHNQLYESIGNEGLEYLTNRGIPEKIIRRFGLGFAPNSRDALVSHLRELGYKDDELITAGLAQLGDKGLRDIFRSRIMFPIIAQSGEIIAFGGRVMDSSQPKYLNTSDTPVFNKRKNLYAMNLLKKKKNNIRAIIAEGYMDVIALNMFGFDYAVASLGTAVTREQIKLLYRNATDIILAYDGDHAGIDATHKAINIMTAEKIKAKVIALPAGIDPDEFIHQNGEAAFSELVANALPSLEYLLLETKNAANLNDEQGRAAYALSGAAIVGKYAFDSIETEMYLKRISRETGFSMEALYRSIGLANTGTAINIAKAAENKSSNSARESVKPTLVAERSVLALLIKHPELAKEARSSLLPDCFSVEEHKSIFEEILKSAEDGKPINTQELLMQCSEDAEKSSAVSAICIEEIDFVEPKKYLQDCVGKLNIWVLEAKRAELKEKLDSFSQTSDYSVGQDFVDTVKSITQIDIDIKKLKANYRGIH